jgi:peptidoglycan/xylan/chitin deacetylase (PgdA/CDA1 family)
MTKSKLFILTMAVALFVLGIRAAGEAVASAGRRKLPIYSVETPVRAVSLGFNCAWDDADIPELIRILAAEDVKVTFFLSGSWCTKYPESVKALYEAGHEIGSHSNTHADMTGLSRERMVEEVVRCNNKIKAITGLTPKLFRMPSGSYNRQVIETVEGQGMIPIQWDCDSLDYENPSPESMRRRVLAGTKNGSIMLFHSGAKNTPLALPGIIADLKARGYVIIPVSELLLPEPYVIDHEGRQHPAPRGEAY